MVSINVHFCRNIDYYLYGILIDDYTDKTLRLAWILCVCLLRL